MEPRPTEATSSMEMKDPMTAGGGAWKGNRQRGGRRRNTRFTPQKPAFKGRCEDLEGSIFDVGPTQAATFTRTKKEITEYVGRKHGAYVRAAIEKLECMKLTMEQDRPTAPPEGADAFEVEAYKVRIKRYVERLIQYEDDMRKAYSVVHGQCTDAMIQKLSADEHYDTAKVNSDPILLLKIIRKVCFKYEAQVYPPLAAVRALITLCRTVQGDLTSDIDWLEQFENLITAAEACGLSFGFPGVRKYVLENQYGAISYEDLGAAARAQVDKKTSEIVMATIYVENSNNGRHSHLKRKLENDYLVDNDNYPESMNDAQNLLINYKGEPITRRHTQGTSVAFAQQAETPRRDKSGVTCYRCGKKGHYSYEDACKEADVKAYQQQQGTPVSTPDPKGTQGTGQSSTQLFNLGNIDNYDDSPYQVMFCTAGYVHTDAIDYSTVLNQSKGRIDPSWLLLDNQSTVNVFCNPRLLVNIRQVDRKMYIHCNAGVATTNWVGDFPGFGTVWYHKDGIANILSLSKVRKEHFVSYASHPDNIFRVYSKDGSKYREFRQSAQGLYYSSIKDASIALTMEGHTIRTVEENKSNTSDLDQRRAEKARKLQDTVNVSTKELLNLIDNGAIPNCPVTRDDVRLAEKLFGKSLVALKGKTVRRPEPHVRVEIQSIPPTIMNNYQRVTIGADIMYVNGLRFFITISRHLLFGTVEAIADSKAGTLERCVRGVKAAYSKRGFILSVVNMDIQFKPIQASLEAMGVTPNFVSQDEHVPEVERYIRTIKSRVRGIQCTLPFKRLPGRMTIELVASQVFWWNSMPKPRGVSQTLSPRTLVTGMTVDYNKHLKLQFGEYVQTHEMTDNDTRHERTVGAIALRPSGNSQGGFLFYSLKSGRVLARNRCTPLPMPNEVIDRVDELANNYPEGLDFRDRNGGLINDGPTLDDDDGGDSEGPDNEPHPVLQEEAQSVEANEQVIEETPPSGSTVDDVAGSDTGQARENIVRADVPTDAQQGTHETPGQDDKSIATHDNTNTGSSPEDEINHQAGGYNLRDRTGRNYGHLKTAGYTNVTDADTPKNDVMHTFAMVINAAMEYSADESSYYKQVHEALLTQYGMKAGLKIFGQRGVEAIQKELQQLHDREVVKPVDPGDLTPEQRNKALAYLMFLKEKRCGKIKGRGCADGRKQRNWMTKEDTTSPTVSTPSLMLSCMIDAYEGRDVATADIPGAFLQTEDNSGDTHLRLDGIMLELLRMIDPKLYEPHIRTDSKGKKYMYVECLKAIYGTLNAALLFWLKLSKDLQSWGFEMNPYDWCVMNKEIDGKQCTVLWHVDDIKASHVDDQVITGILKKIDDKYGQITPLVVNRGKMHDYLGMTIDYSKAGEVRFTMYDYVASMLDELPDSLSAGEAVTPAAEHLFEINTDNPVRLSDEDRIIFHTNTAKLLFLSKRARPDIQLPVSFLCTRVQAPDQDDWKKLDRVMKYIRGSIGLPLILRIDNTGVIQWYVDAAFAVHHDMKSHTGVAMTMGKGAALAVSSKQKLNTRSSTEAEHVGVDDAITQIIWTRYFMEAQGFPIKDNIVYQDNQSAIKLEKNGKRSSGKRTRHMAVRYFFVTDRIASGEMTIKYCPTGEMLGDYFTKPLQGGQFRRFRNAILGIDETDVPEYNAGAIEEIQQRKADREAKARENAAIKQQTVAE